MHKFLHKQAWHTAFTHHKHSIYCKHCIRICHAHTEKTARMSPTEATIYYSLFWFLFILQFINWGLWHCILPGLCLAASLIWWFVLELQNYTSDSIVTGTLVVIFVQFSSFPAVSYS